MSVRRSSCRQGCPAALPPPLALAVALAAAAVPRMATAFVSARDRPRCLPYPAIAWLAASSLSKLPLLLRTGKETLRKDKLGCATQANHQPALQPDILVVGKDGGRQVGRGRQGTLRIPWNLDGSRTMHLRPWLRPALVHSILSPMVWLVLHHFPCLFSRLYPSKRHASLGAQQRSCAATEGTNASAESS